MKQSSTSPTRQRPEMARGTAREGIRSCRWRGIVSRAASGLVRAFFPLVGRSRNPKAEPERRGTASSGRSQRLSRTAGAVANRRPPQRSVRTDAGAGREGPLLRGPGRTSLRPGPWRAWRCRRFEDPPHLPAGEMGRGTIRRMVEWSGGASRRSRGGTPPSRDRGARHLPVPGRNPILLHRRAREGPGRSDVRPRPRERGPSRPAPASVRTLRMGGRRLATASAHARQSLRTAGLRYAAALRLGLDAPRSADKREKGSHKPACHAADNAAPTAAS
jgi:hypothetical protein